MFKLITKWINRSLLKKHMNYTNTMLDVIYDTQYIYKEWEKKKYFKTVATDDYELRKLEKQEQTLNKKLSTRRNAIIQMIMEYEKDYQLKTKDGAVLTEDYLKSKSTKELADFSEKLLQKILNLEFTDETKEESMK